MYRLKKYYLRSSLTFVGPLLALGFYILICLTFLRNPPINDIVDSVPIGARWVHFTWIIAAIFMLDLSRTGLANIEAAALMHPWAAPRDGLKLMWHTDGKWANPLWWFRACRSVCWVLLGRNASLPGMLWTFLSLTTLMLFVGLPLTGLSVELSDIYTPSANKATIYGPSAAWFNARSAMGLPQQIRSRWRTGQPTTPFNDGVLYAPHGTSNVTKNYLSDRAEAYATSIPFFAGPAVRKTVSGRAWGVYANISCNPVPKTQLQSIRVINFTSCVNACVLDDETQGCELKWFDDVSRMLFNGSTGNMFPMVLNGTYYPEPVPLFSYVAVADGFTLRDGSSPFIRPSNHDDLTLDSMVNGRSQEEVTTAIFELYFWQSGAYGPPILDQIAEGGYDDPVDVFEYSYWKGPKLKNTTMVGMGIHCDVTTEVGIATLHPNTQTFSAFMRNSSFPSSDLHEPGIEGHFVYPPQILAIAALSDLSSLETEGYVGKTLDSQQTAVPWADLHYAIDSAADVFRNETESIWGTVRTFKALRPKDLQHALYKLLGESVIMMMDEGGVSPWQGELYEMEPAKYITNGIVPWPYALAFVAVWAFVMCASALWSMVLAKPRWATSLGGFEMFRFGAQYADEVEDFTEVDFRGCSDALQRIPGMVGMLPGTGVARPTLNGMGFVGLSENVTSGYSEYTLRRKEAAATRTT